MSAKPKSLAQEFAELEQLTAEFERGDIDLEAGIPKFKRGLELARKLKLRIKKLENEIEEIRADYSSSGTDQSE